VEWQLEWTARTADNPLEEKQFSAGAFSFEELKRLRLSTIDFESDRGNTDALASEHSINESEFGPETFRFLVSRQTAYAAQMFVRWEGDDGASSWALTSLRLDFRYVGHRVGRRGT